MVSSLSAKADRILVCAIDKRELEQMNTGKWELQNKMDMVCENEMARKPIIVKGKKYTNVGWKRRGKRDYHGIGDKLKSGRYRAMIIMDQWLGGESAYVSQHERDTIVHSIKGAVKRFLNRGGVVVVCGMSGIPDGYLALDKFCNDDFTWPCDQNSPMIKVFKFLPSDTAKNMFEGPLKSHQHNQCFYLVGDGVPENERLFSTASGKTTLMAMHTTKGGGRLVYSGESRFEEPTRKILEKIIQMEPVKKKKTNTKKDAAKKVAAKKTPAKKVSAKKRSTPISSYQGRKGEKYMSAAMKKHFLAVLIDWREHLKEEMQKTFDHLKNKGESYADPIDRASQEEEFAFELRTRDRERKLISKIAMSLEQIKQDDYGYCYACGIEIGVKRLEARPTATHCIDCKTLDEIKEKQLGG